MTIIAMAQRSLSQWFSSSSSTGMSGLPETDHDSEQEDMLITPVDSLGGDSGGNHSDEDQQELAPPVTKKVARSMISIYKTKHPWLTSGESGKEAFCKFCQQLYCGSYGLPKGSDGTFIMKPFTKWSKATGSSAKNNKLLKHQLSNSHRQAVARAEMCSEVERRGSVFTQLQSCSDAEKYENLIMISKYVKVVYWLMKHEVAHTKNYESLIELCTDLDESNHLANWQRLRAKNATYKSLATSLEMVTTIGEFIDAKTVSELSDSFFLSLMADEATDLRNRTELSVCLRYLTVAGCTNECFIDIQCVPNETAEVVTDGIISIIESRGIDFSKVIWLAFDGASNMSGHISGVQARLKEQKCEEATYVHCRSHILQLACVQSSEKHKPIKQLFSAMNSMWRMFSVSPKKTHALKEVREALQEPDLALVRAGDTRWTSHYKAVHAIVKCLKGIIVTLQHLHQDAGDLSSEAGGLLLTFQDRESIILLFAVKDILDPVCRFSLKLQHYNAALCDVPDLLDTVTSRLNEISTDKDYMKSATDFIQECEFPILDSTKHSNQQIHRILVKPYINTLSENIKSRFNDTVTSMCSATSIFDPKKVKDDAQYGMNEVANLLPFIPA